MKGIILAGGTGSRLRPLTDVVNKHALPVGPKPMIDWPIGTIKKAGIDDLMIVTGKEHADSIFRYCGSGARYGMRITYAIQDQAGGIAEALGLCETWAGRDMVLVILGDNIIEAGPTPEWVQMFERGHQFNACIFLKTHPFPKRFGCVEYDDQSKIVGIQEKPDDPPSNDVVIGMYVYPKSVFSVIHTLGRSDRGELEITDVNNNYLNIGLLQHERVHGWWSDAGTPESYRAANEWAWRRK